MKVDRAVGIVVLLVASGVPLAASAGASLVLENHTTRWELDRTGGICSLLLKPGRELLAQPGARLMLIQVGKTWRGSSSLAWEQAGETYRLRIGFQGTAVVGRAVVRSRGDYFQIETQALEGPGAEEVGRWVFLNVPAGLIANVGAWLNVAWDERAALAVLALDERTDAGGSPRLAAAGVARLGFGGRKAALVACPTPDFLTLVRRIEQEQGLPAPTIGGQWAKTSPETRRSWLITALSAAGQPAEYAPERVFKAAAELGVRYVIIGLHSWNASLGSYPLNKRHFPDGVQSLGAVARQAHARGLKLGLHVMTRSIAKNDPLVTPTPDAHLAKDGEVTLAADVDQAAVELPAGESPAGFGVGEGYWAFGGMDVQIDDEIVHYTALRGQTPYALLGCRRGAYGTRAAGHKAGAKIRHITERYGWYVADAELSARIGRNLAALVDRAELDAICFDGADVRADAEVNFFEGHQVALGLQRHAQRDVMLFSNGTTHYGWHLMARGGEDDSMARGYQGWVDQHIVAGWAGWHVKNFMPPDLAWVGIFGATPTMWACRPDDIELVCARSMALDGAIGWALAACYGGPSSMTTWERNGRREEIALVAREYEKLRTQAYFKPAERQPLGALGSHWRLAGPAALADRWRIVPADYVRSPVLRRAEGESWPAANRFDAQPLRVRIEALPALAPYGAKGNRVLADFERLELTASGRAGAKAAFERTGQAHAEAGAVARLSCVGPEATSKFPQKLFGHGETAWAQAAAEWPVKLDLRRHRALGLWIHGDGGGEVLNVQVMENRQSYLHFYQPIDFKGWKYCELGEPEGDRVMDYFLYEKFALHDTRLGAIGGLVLMILNPPRGKRVELLLGRIEALEELGGRVARPRIRVGAGQLSLGVELQPGQYLETGDLWGTRDAHVLRVFDADGKQLSRQRVDNVPSLPGGTTPVRVEWGGAPAGRAKATLMLLGGS